MAHLQYNGIDLQIERTAECRMDAVYDDSGLDLLTMKVRLAVVAVWSPFATSAPLPVLGFGVPAANVGLSIATLRQALMQPQQRLIYSIGPDRVFDVPTGLSIAGKGIVQPACDPAGGPFPQSCRVLSIHGDKTAVVEYVVEFHVNDYMYYGNGNYVLSHRWKVTSHVGEQWLTTRVTEGRATFRLDALQAYPAVADQWRRNFTLHVPPGFIRQRVDVTATEDGRELHYRVEDRESYLNLGTSSQAVKVEINATAGQEFPFHSVKDVWKGWQMTREGSHDAVRDAMHGNLLGFGMRIAGMMNDLLPQNKCNAIIRVYGQANANLAALGQLAVDIAIDRFSPGWSAGVLYPVSCYLTQSLDSDGAGPVMELRMEFLPLNTAAVLGAFGGGTFTLMNLGTDIKSPPGPGGGGGGLIASRTQIGNPPFPSDSHLIAPANNACRGMWVAFLVTQALMQNGKPCVVPSADNNLPAPAGQAQTPLPPNSYDLL